MSAGGPLCAASTSIPLAPASQRQLAAVLHGEAPSAQLLRLNVTGEATPALYPLLWLLRGDACVGAPLQLRDVLPSEPAGQWAGLWTACNASLLPLPSKEGPAPQLEGPGSTSGSAAQQRRLAAAGGGHAAAATVARWWQLSCWAINGTAGPAEQPQELGVADCGAGFGGPR